MLNKFYLENLFICQLPDVVWIWNFHWGFSLTNGFNLWCYHFVPLTLSENNLWSVNYTPATWKRWWFGSAASFYQEPLFTMHWNGRWVYKALLSTVYAKNSIECLMSSLYGFFWYKIPMIWRASKHLSIPSQQ